MDRSYWILAISLVACCLSTTTASEADEIALNQVRVLFYEASLGAWQSHNMSSTFKSTVAATCTTVCNTDLAICGLGASATFTASDVVIVSEQQIPGYLAVFYYISFPAGVTLTSPNVTEFILNKDSAADAVINGREAIYLALGYEIVEVDNEVYPKKIDWTMNYIMIPVTLLIVLLVVGICLLLQFRASHAEKMKLKKLQKENRRMRHEQRKKEKEQKADEQRQMMELKKTKVAPNSDDKKLKKEKPRDATKNEDAKTEKMEKTEKTPLAPSLPPPPDYRTNREPRPTQVTNGDTHHLATVAHSNPGATVTHDNEQTNTLPPLDTDSDTTKLAESKRAKRKKAKHQKLNFENPAYQIEVQESGGNESESTSAKTEPPDPETMFEFTNQKRAAADSEMDSLVAEDLP